MLNWIDLLWLSIGCSAALLGAFHLSIWLRNRQQRMHGAFALFAFSMTASTAAEWLAMQAQTTTEYTLWLRWAHALVLPLVVVLVLFVRTMGPTRLWLAMAAVGARAAATVANFTTGDSISFISVTALREIPVWGGDPVSGPIGIPNPWNVLAQLSNLLLLALVIDLTVATWRLPTSPQRTRALRIAAALMVFITAPMLLISAVLLTGLPLPVAFAPAFLGLALVMSHELGGEVLRAAQLARRLRIVESTLRHNQGDLDMAGRAAGIGLWTWDHASGRVSLSAPAARMFGFEPGTDVSAAQVRERIDPADLAGVNDAVARARQQRETDFSAEFRVHRPGRPLCWVAVHGRFAGGGAGRDLAHGVMFDVTGRRNTDEQFQLVVSASPAAILLVDASGRILLANAAAAVLTGYAVEELAGLEVDRLVPESLRIRHSQQRQEYAQAANRRRMLPRREVAILRRDGGTVPVEIALNPVDTDGEPLVIVGIDDIGERRAKEREVAMQREIIAHMSRINLLSELSGSLAHELNQPLAAILANAQASTRFLDRDEPDLAEVREGLAQIIASDKHAGEVIRRLRAMLRKEPPEFIPLEPNEVVRDVLRIVRSDLIDRHVEIHEDLTPGLPLVPGDRVQLQQVLLNLIMNASEAMDGMPSGHRITLRTRAHAEGVLLQVEDVGHGIPPGDLERIFQTFVSSKPSGLGFGLSLCATLAEAHGGRLWASNNPERGATMHLLLPAAPPPPE